MGHARTARRICPLTLWVLAVWTGCGGRGDERLVVDGVERTYVLHLPAAIDSMEPVALVVALHPFTGSGRSMQRLTGFDAVADAEGFVVVYPDGLQRRWNALPDMHAADDVAYLVALVERLAAQYPIDRDRVFVVGASSGAMMTYRLLCQAPEVFAAGAVVMGGPMPVDIAGACAGQRPVPLLIIHGTADTILPWEGGEVYAGPGRTLNLLSMTETIARWREWNGCAADGETSPIADADGADGTVTTVTQFACASGSSLVVFRVDGGGHTWPDSPDSYPEFIVGATARDFSATQTVWQFFGENDRSVVKEDTNGLAVVDAANGFPEK